MKSQMHQSVSLGMDDNKLTRKRTIRGINNNGMMVTYDNMMRRERVGRNNKIVINLSKESQIKLCDRLTIMVGYTTLSLIGTSVSCWQSSRLVAQPNPFFDRSGAKESSIIPMWIALLLMSRMEWHSSICFALFPLFLILVDSNGWWTLTTMI
jgi:hypothetical protein